MHVKFLDVYNYTIEKNVCVLREYILMDLVVRGHHKRKKDFKTQKEKSSRNGKISK